MLSLGREAAYNQPVRSIVPDTGGGRPPLDPVTAGTFRTLR